MKNKKIIIIIVVILLIAGTIWLVSKKENDDEGNQKISKVIKIDGLEITNITNQYEAGITTIRAEIYNDSDVPKDANLKIILKNEKAEEIKSTIQVVEQLEPKARKVILAGVTGDYSQTKKIEIKSISDEEIQSM